MGASEPVAAANKALLRFREVYKKDRARQDTVALTSDLTDAASIFSSMSQLGLKDVQRTEAIDTAMFRFYVWLK